MSYYWADSIGGKFPEPSPLTRVDVRIVLGSEKVGNLIVSYSTKRRVTVALHGQEGIVDAIPTSVQTVPRLVSPSPLKNKRRDQDPTYC